MRARSAGRCGVSRGDLGGAGVDAAQREEGNEDDVLGCAVVDDRFVLALSEIVMVLDGGNRHDFPRALDLIDRDLRDADVADFSAVAVLLDGGETLLDRCLRVDPMQVVESDAVGAEATKAFVDFSFEVFRTAAAGAARPAFCGDDTGVWIGSERRPADRGLAFAAGIAVSGVDHPDARGDGLL